MKSTMYMGALLVLFVATGATARDMAEAPAPAGWHHHKHPGPALAPGPAGWMHDHANEADLLFILSADQAEFTDTTTLQLTGVSATVQYHDSYEKGATAGIIKTTVFANDTAGARYVSADGAWLSSPDATLIGIANSSTTEPTAVLLALSNPVYNPAANSVTFTVRVLPAEENSLKLHRGVANSLVWKSKDGASTPVVTAVQPGATLTDAALFIDSNKASLTPAAQTEDWRGGWGGGWNGGWNGGWGRGWGGWGGWGGGGGWGRGWGWGWGR